MKIDSKTRSVHSALRSAFKARRSLPATLRLPKLRFQARFVDDMISLNDLMATSSLMNFLAIISGSLNRVPSYSISVSGSWKGYRVTKAEARALLRRPEHCLRVVTCCAIGANENPNLRKVCANWLKSLSYRKNTSAWIKDGTFMRKVGDWISTLALTAEIVPRARS